MSEDQNDKQPRTKTALEETKLRLVGEILKGSRRPATWSVLMFGNQLRVSCYTNLENDKNNGRIEAKMDSITAFAFFDLVEQAINTQGPSRFSLECKTVVNGDWKNPVLESTLITGRGEDGVVYVGIVSADTDRPRLQFRLRPTDFHALLGSDRAPMPESKVSEIFGRGYLSLIRLLSANVLNTHFREAQRPANSGNKGGGNWNKGGNGYQGRGNGGNGYQNRNGGGYNNRGGNGGGNWNNDRNSAPNSTPAPAEPAFDPNDDIAF